MRGLPGKIKSQKNKGWIFPAYQVRVVDMQRKTHSIDTVEPRTASPMDGFQFEKEN